MKKNIISVFNVKTMGAALVLGLCFTPIGLQQKF
jgi:hypothetical protein